MKSVYTFHGRLHRMLVLTVLIFMATVPMGNGFYNTKKSHLKAMNSRRGTSERARASDSDNHPKNRTPSDNTSVKQVTITNGYSLTRGLRRKRKSKLSGSGILRSKRAKGKVNFCYTLYSNSKKVIKIKLSLVKATNQGL